MSDRVTLGVDPKVESRDILITRVDAAVDWMRKNSVWPMPMGAPVGPLRKVLLKVAEPSWPDWP